MMNIESEIEELSRVKYELRWETGRLGWATHNLWKRPQDELISSAECLDSNLDEFYSGDEGDSEFPIYLDAFEALEGLFGQIHSGEWELKDCNELAELQEYEFFLAGLARQRAIAAHHLSPAAIYDGFNAPQSAAVAFVAIAAGARCLSKVNLLLNQKNERSQAGKRAAKARSEKFHTLRDAACNLYKAREWKSRRFAAFQIFPEIETLGLKLGHTFSKEKGPITVYNWLLKCK